VNREEARDALTAQIGELASTAGAEQVLKLAQAWAALWYRPRE